MFPLASRWAWIGFVGVVSEGLAADPKPPKPNPANPVNYIEWINQTFGGDIEDNAYDEYQKAYDRLQSFDGDWKGALDSPWSERADLTEWLDANREALESFRTAAAKRECFFRLPQLPGSADPRMRDFLLSLDLGAALRTHREGVRGIIADAWRGWQEGDREQFTENAVLAVRSGHHFDKSLFPIERMRGIASAALGYKAIRQALHMAADRITLAAELIAKLKETDPVWPPFDRTVLGERLTAWDVSQRLYIPGPKKGTWTLHVPVLRATGLGELIAPIDWTGLIPKPIAYDTTLAEFNACYDAMERWCRSPYHRVAAKTEQFRQMGEQSRNPLVKSLLPSLTRARVLHEKIVTERRATHLIMHLLVHQGKTGRFPEALRELAAPDVAELRIDPFSGRDFVYRRKGDSFTLYSVAENLKDDGGRHDEKWADGDFVFWPVQD